METQQLPDLASFVMSLSGQDLVLRFPMDDQSIRLAHIQSGNFIKQTLPSAENLREHFAGYHASQWQECDKVDAWDLPENARVLDLGSGLGVLDIIQALRRSDLRFWLVDRSRDEYHDNPISHGSDHPYYNSWLTVEHLIQANGLDRKRFVLQPPDGPWPRELDLIISTWCWCWHLPLEVYIDSVLNSLALGGKLCVDIRHQHFEEISSQISTHMNSQPRITEYQGRPWISDPNPHGYRCCWVRQ